MKESCKNLKSESDPTSRGNDQSTGKTKTEEHDKYHQRNASIQIQAVGNSQDKAQFLKNKTK